MSYRAFVSSTFVDLKEHRAHVIRSLRRAGFSVDPMEDWTADSDEPKKFSQERLKGCDLCIMLVAFRRGYVPDGETLSITQLEYEAAVKQGTDVLPFLLDQRSAWYAEFDERKEDPEIDTWRECLRNRHVAEFFTLEPRSIDMTGALGRWLGKRNEGQPDNTELHRVEWPKDNSEGSFMSDIFISYKREDQPVARRFANALEKEGWNVWWDPKLRAGQRFNEVIEKALKEAKCVIVLWSEESVQSTYVLDEAEEALEQGKLLPVKIENMSLPMRFKRVHTLSLIGWDGSTDFAEFRKLLEDVREIIGPVMK